ncbi:MAG: hypothetical protein QOH50_5057 [Kribbellaceae bacterium]|nr:hypothetical protein [Kribbellaceae bacterium]
MNAASEDLDAGLLWESLGEGTEGLVRIATTAKGVVALIMQRD